jgi:hypothetical protein
VTLVWLAALLALAGFLTLVVYIWRDERSQDRGDDREQR